MDVRLYVGNLPYSATEDELRELFAQAGTVNSVALIMDRDTGRSRGFAFVEMGTQAEAEEAIKKFDNFNLGGRDMRVNIARPREDRGGRGGGRRGGGGGGRRY
ncbi:MAG: RNA recognition motif domain-containing protein [Anaerolineales bacterium]